MVSMLFINATILISFLALTSQIFKDVKIGSNLKLSVKIAFGVLNGTCGCILMFYTIPISNKTLMDLRIITLIISAIYCGFISVLSTSVMLAIFRIGYFGINESSVIAVINLFVLSLFFSLVFKLKINVRKKWIIMNILNLTTASMIFLILIKDFNKLLLVLINYWFASILVSIIVFCVLQYISKTNELYRKLKIESTEDFLTGLINVREFDRLLNRSIKEAIEKNEDLSILLIDIDFFKKVNDTYGHAVGDMVLKDLAYILKQSCRSFDIVSRNGGEEFTIILLDCDSNHSYKIAEKVRINIEKHCFKLPNGEKLNITVSIGVSSYPDKVKDINNILKIADDALYLAKRNGRNRVVLQ
ncbi:GGDEF domain-containing protein [Clostridium drakei]|uniref:GGDEF domain-containing protein n=1 Tax=Clostridium drakei TaxID=332101 RepID=A0A2U8DWE9_9CLOT|nr:diguanylate cyclase [Clostridium drakei]AWI06715.1 GGDEF domain-containing protein [Clostridium drakei]